MRRTLRCSGWLWAPPGPFDREALRCSTAVCLGCLPLQGEAACTGHAGTERQRDDPPCAGATDEPVGGHEPHQCFGELVRQIERLAEIID